MKGTKMDWASRLKPEKLAMRTILLDMSHRKCASISVRSKVERESLCISFQISTRNRDSWLWHNTYRARQLFLKIQQPSLAPARHGESSC